MVVGEPSINNIMGGIENTGIRLHNHKRKLKQRFDIIKKLGQGTYGKVQLGINKETGQEVAIKTIKKSKIESEADLIRIRREIQIMSSVQHPNIIHIYEVFENKDKMVLVMEYAAGGELYDYLSERKVLLEDEARRIFRQIATACYYCHKHKICHRDLKLENILLDENNNAKIADFGLSNVFDDQRLLSTFCGSPLYASPEIVKGTPYHGPEVDCWSLGVLLYTLVYGAMPFDGSNFKRLVKQISQGDYFEPKTPSPASPLIKEMLTVNPKHRANIEKICAHWWVNETYDESCLEVSEELANQTPVRLDLLLSLAPPPPQLESDKLVVTEEASGEATAKGDALAPTRSQSVGSLMELSSPAERILKELKSTAKRKLETTVSTDRANLSGDNLKRKDKIIKENTVADISVHGVIHENASMEDASMAEEGKKEMEVEENVEEKGLAEQGAACSEILKEEKQKVELKEKTAEKKVEAVKEEKKKVEKEKENEEKTSKETKEAPTPEKPESKVPLKKKVIKKKPLAEKNSEAKPTPEAKQPEKVEKKAVDVQETQSKAEVAPKVVERRRSRIFETAEKFQNLISANDNNSKTTGLEKPKKIIIPGVSVDGFKKEFERKASLTTPTSPPVTNGKSPLSRKVSVDKEAEEQQQVVAEKEEPTQVEEEKVDEEEIKEPEEKIDDRKKKAVSIISSALDKEGTRKSKSRPCMYRKPPVPFGSGGRSASGSIGMPLSPEEDKRFLKLQVGPNDTRTATVEVSTPEHTRYITDPFKPEENKTSSAEITLKSATFPRKKTTKAEIRLDYPVPKPATMEFKTEMAHRVEAPPKMATQKSEVTIPVVSPPIMNFRSASVEPKSTPRERIIPISFEKDADEKTQPLPKPPVPKPFQSQKSNQSQRSSSLSRQSTQESDSDTLPSSTGEPIRKSPREFIIPIAVEGGGYVTPRAGSLEPSETGSASTLTSRSSKFERARRMNSLLKDDGSEDEASPFAALHRHSSFGRDSDNEDSRRDAFHMHRLRSSRPRKTSLEHNDSVSSGEDDDDDGFEILTAENLFSTLLSRVRDLTQRLNVEDGGRPGFPSNRLLSHFDHGTNFWNLHNRLDPLRKSPFGSAFANRDRESPLSRQYSTPWRRSVSRDLASDIESAFKDTPTSTTTTTTTVPRGDDKSETDSLNLSDLDLKKLKLSDEDALALSYLTPGLSKRIQKQLLAQLAPSEARKLSRTLSMRNSRQHDENGNFNEDSGQVREKRSFLPVKSTGEVVNGEGLKPRAVRSMSLRDTKLDYRSPRVDYSLRSPDSSISESRNDDSSSYSDSSRLYSSDLSRGSISRYVSPIDSSKNRRVSRFLRPDFYDAPKEENSYIKEKKEREMETQKVLKEIRDKRIKNRLNLRRERSASRSAEIEKVKSLSPVHQETETESILKDVSDNIKLIESNVKKVPDYVNVPEIKEPKTHISKLVRPKSYPTESSQSESEAKPKSKLKKGLTKTKKDDESPVKENGKSKILQSIEKRIGKLRSHYSSAAESESDDKKSNVENVIQRLREQSLPRNLDHITESGLLQRAVSVEDMHVGDCKPLQTSKKSVSKILGLFKKYEEKDKKKEEKSKSKKSDEDKTTKQISPEPTTVDNKPTKISKLPVNTYRRSLNLETPKEPITVSKSFSKTELPSTDRQTLKLDFKPDPKRLSATTDESSLLLSPGDESCDSWSVCSDYHHELPSPVSPTNGYLCSGDEGESVIDRIRRKSFYSRFNEKKRPRRSGGSFRDLDLYKELQRPSYRSAADRRLVDYRTPLKGDEGLRGYSKYQTYNPRAFGGVYEANSLNDAVTTGRLKKYSAYSQPSSISRKSLSPVYNSEQCNNNTASTSHRYEDHITNNSQTEI